MRYEVPSWGQEKFEKRFKRLSRKAAKLGVSVPTFQWTGSTRNEPVRDMFGNPTGRFHVYYEVNINNVPQVKIDGWELVAMVQHTHAGNIVTSFPGHEEQVLPEEFKEIKNSCDHCHTKRRRKDTFVLLHENGTFCRVGRTCLRDFLGHMAPEEIVRIASLSFDISGFGVDWGMPTGGDFGYDPERFLAFVSSSCRTLGWVSKKKAFEEGLRPTVQSTLSEMGLPSYKQVQPTDEDYKRAQDALAWAQGFSKEDCRNDFLHNLHVVSQLACVEEKHCGILAALISVYQRHLNDLARRESSQDSEWLGNVGDKLGRKLSSKDKAKGATALPIWTATCVFIRELPSDYGVTTLCKFQDAQGNLGVWFASGPIEMDQGVTYEIQGTIKKTDSYRDQKQTTLARVKFSPVSG